MRNIGANEGYVLALIPARGGSKSVPRKNLLKIMGKPLIAYSIEQALASKYINRVIVSTDDTEIAEVARQCGAEVPFMRPSELAGDSSTDFDVFEHCLNWLLENESGMPSQVVHLRPTGPARHVEKIDDAINALVSSPSSDSLRSVSVATQSPYKMWRANEEGNMEPVVQLPDIPEAHSTARQNLPLAYWQNGYVDIVRPSTILEKKSMVGSKVVGYVLKDKVPDIDYVSDIPAVEAAIRKIQSGSIGDDEDTENRVPV